jgi:hypothetical protein
MLQGRVILPGSRLGRGFGQGITLVPSHQDNKASVLDFARLKVLDYSKYVTAIAITGHGQRLQQNHNCSENQRYEASFTFSENETVQRGVFYEGTTTL